MHDISPSGSTSAPFIDDIVHYFVTKSISFATGQFTVALVENTTNGETALSTGTFLYVSSSTPPTKLVQPLETNSQNLICEIDSQLGHVTLTNWTSNTARYHVRISTLADINSAMTGY
jgi:hypothetical protein